MLDYIHYIGKFVTICKTIAINGANSKRKVEPSICQTPLPPHQISSCRNIRFCDFGIITYSFLFMTGTSTLKSPKLNNVYDLNNHNPLVIQ